MIFGYLLQVSTSTQCNLPKMAVGRMQHWEFNGRFDGRSRQYPGQQELKLDVRDPGFQRDLGLKQNLIGHLRDITNSVDR